MNDDEYDSDGYNRAELDAKLAAAAKACSEDAVRRAFAAGLSIVVEEGGKLVRIYPDGRKTIEKDHVGEP